MNVLKIKQNLGVCAIILIANISSFVLAQTTTAPQPSREQVTIKPVASPTPQQSPTPKTSPTPVQPSTVSPTPVPIQPVQNLSELQMNIRRVLQNLQLERGRIGVKIISLETGKIIFAENADKYFMPASNMKSFTVAAALDRLTPDFRFTTSVYALNKPDANGTIRGDLIVYGRGDPSISASFNEGDYYKGINNLADKIAASGIKRIEGNLVGDESYLTGDALSSTWEWDDLQWYYGAEISALTVNDNAVDLKIMPGANLGLPCFVSLLPANSSFTIVNKTQTISAGEKRQIEVFKKLGTNVLEIRGTMPINDAGYSGSIAVEKPANLFVFLLRNALQQKGIIVTGQTRTVDAKTKGDENHQNTTQNFDSQLAVNKIEIARLESPPLSFIAAKTLKPSQNLYTELILRVLGETVGDKSDSRKTSAERGLEVVAKFLTEAGIASDAIVQFDGSGLSRHNLITPAATVQLYSFMSKHRFASSFQAALPIAGVDGTLKNRFQNTVAASNVRAKTGTIDQVGTLSGYMTTANGEQIVFSILTNNLPDNSLRRQTMDDIVVLLANFNGKLN
jgi:D-alanyl-D-alanine carboxypeptidase/D-alanyl-D-alanine-endopeptidase (penicillin-binding protein 4)